MGNDFRIGIELGGNNHHGGGHDYPQYPQYPHQQPRLDPITFEARQIANELDSGDANRAAEHLRRDLQQMPSFRDQKELVEKVDLFDRKDVGADLHLRHPDREGGIWDDISITPPRYYDRGQGGGRPGYPVYGHGQGRAPEVDIRIDLNLFKNHGRR
jgi:hypothetical protein